MNPFRQMSFLPVMLAAFMCLAASCGPRKPVTGVRCAFADPVFMTEVWICQLVAEYCIANSKWPRSKVELEEQNHELLEQERAGLRPEDVKEASEFFERFTLVEMTGKDDRLVLRYRFKMDGQKVDRTVAFAPGPTVDDILHSAIAEPLPD